MRYEADVISRNIQRKQRLKRFFIILLYIILIPTALFSLLLILIGLGNSYELPSFFDMDVYIVVSNSMAPRINADDVVIVKKHIEQSDIKKGNIISYRRDDGEIITHRIDQIIKQDFKDAYITKGDANEAADEDIVIYSDVIGKVIYVVPGFGKVIALFKNKIFFLSAVGVILLLLVYDKKIKERKEKRRKIRERYNKKSDFYF